VTFTQGGTVNNSGTIAPGFQGINLLTGAVNNFAGALINAGTNGIVIGAFGATGGPGTVVNAGTIRGNTEAVSLRDGGTVTNQAGSLIEVTNTSNAVSVLGGTTRTVTNDGIIRNTTPVGNFAAGISIAGGTVTNNSAGTIFGTYNAIWGNGASALTVINAGLPCRSRARGRGRNQPRLAARAQRDPRFRVFGADRRHRRQPPPPGQGDLTVLTVPERGPGGKKIGRIAEKLPARAGFHARLDADFTAPRACCARPEDHPIDRTHLMTLKPRTLTLAAAAGAVLALGPATSLAQGTVTPAIYDRIMKADHPTIKAYRGANTNKAYAACFDWSKGAATPGVPAGGYSYGLRSETVARQNAMQSCARIMKERNAKCTCQVIDVNGHQAN
jgi:hypothetical protein